MGSRCGCGQGVSRTGEECRRCRRGRFARRPGLFAFAATQLAILVSPFFVSRSDRPMLTVTVVIVAVTVMLSVHAQRNPQVKVALLHDHDAIAGGEPYRLASAAYIHAGALHLGFNMLALWSFGRVLENFFSYRWGQSGLQWYAVTYVAGALVTGLLSFAVERRLGAYPSLGASGVVLLVISAVIVLDPSSTILFFFVPLPGWVFLAGFAAISAYAATAGSRAVDAFMTFGTGKVNHVAHLTGLFTGVLCGAVLRLL